MVRWLKNVMVFVMFFAFLAIFAVKLRCVLCVSKPDLHGCGGVQLAYL